ncbi:MAG: helix-hairpin-helix domain-containing protein [Synergistaceae bacterium]
MRNPNKSGLYLILGGIACFLLAVIILHSVKGNFLHEEPVLKTIDVTSNSQDNQERGTIENNRSSISSNSIETTSEKTLNKWIVYVSGAAVNPGVFEVPVNARIYVALGKAGGFAPEADKDAINLAGMLSDGAHVVVPYKKESTPTINTADKKVNLSPKIEQSQVTGGRVNINIADLETLVKLPGIGTKTAQKIIDYRNENGPFKVVDELLEVKGIGVKKLEALKDLVSTER